MRLAVSLALLAGYWRLIPVISWWAQRATGAEQSRTEYQVAIKPEWRA